jgi:NCS2 family nucleobase:cation symporter-2
VAVGFLTLGVMILVTVWGGRFRLYGVLTGIVAGYLAGYAVGLLSARELRMVLDTPVFALPRPPITAGPLFDAALLLPFLIAALSSTAKTVGDVTTCQMINDPAWEEPEMHSIQRGVLADALAVVSAGLCGGMGQSTSSSNVGLSIATATTSRRIAFGAGGLFIALALLPSLAMTFVVMPKPVRGAILVFVACFMIVAGVALIASRSMDTRRTFVVGGAVIAGLTVDVAPWVFKDLPAGLRVLSVSDLGVAALVAIVLNSAFSAGTANR